MDFVANIFTAIPATFRVKLKKFADARDKTVLDYMTLTVGSEKISCINLSIPVKDTEKHIFLDHIDSTKPDTPCTIDDVTIRGQKTKDMFYFAASLLKNLTDKTIVEFTDQSYFPCSISATEIRNVPLNIYYLMFHGKTWYDSMFNATLADTSEQEKYKRLQERRHDAIYKPASFNFKTPALNDALYPLYEKTNTWNDFFDLIEKTYGQQKCKMVYVWLNDALRTITVGNNDIFGFQVWQIDIRNMPLIYYTPKKVYKSGGKRTITFKRKVYIRDVIPRSEDFTIFETL
jgi:hypothetical protein